MADQEPKIDAASPTPEPGHAPTQMSPYIFAAAMFYLVSLIAVFIIYACWPSFKHAVPTALGPLPVGVVWFGATGAVIASLRGIFYYNDKWDSSFNYWHYSRPMFGAVTGSIGALLYWVSLSLGNASPVKVDRATFYVVAFLLGFADKAFIELLKNVTDVVIKPAQKTSLKSPPTETK